MRRLQPHLAPGSAELRTLAPKEMKVRLHSFLLGWNVLFLREILDEIANTFRHGGAGKDAVQPNKGVFWP